MAAARVVLLTLAITRN